MASDVNGGNANFHVVPPPQRPGYMDPYDLYDMDEADEEETKDMKKDALAWLQEHGYTRVLLHGCCVCPYCNLDNRQWRFRDILQHASGIGCSERAMKSRGRHRALEEYLHTDPRCATFRHALGMKG
jgi:hypothetical protein